VQTALVCLFCKPISPRADPVGFVSFTAVQEVPALVTDGVQIGLRSVQLKWHRTLAGGGSLECDILAGAGLHNDAGHGADVLRSFCLAPGKKNFATTHNSIFCMSECSW